MASGVPGVAATVFIFIFYLVKMLTDAGFKEIRGGGKGAHRKFTHPNFAGAVTISGKSGDDVKPYQSKQVEQAIERIEE